MRIRRIALAAPVLLAAVLVGCAGAPADPVEDADPVGDDPGAGDPVACVVGDWSADVDDLAAQLLDLFATQGLPVSATSADGSIRLEITADGTARVTQDLDLTAVADFGGGLATLVQRHRGAGEGAWSFEEQLLRFPEWNDGTLVIEQEITMDGQTVELPIELPETEFGGPLQVAACDDRTMVTDAEGSPFTTTWVRS